MLGRKDLGQPLHNIYKIKNRNFIWMVVHNQVPFQQL